MKIFITGATGFIGNNLALRLAGEGHTIHALCRDINTPVLQHPNIIIFKGDIENITSVKAAMAGCEQVYHLAAFARVWAKDKTIYQRLNVDGTNNILICARQLSVKKIVCTSTAGVLGPSGNHPVHESDKRIGEPFTEYEVTKTEAEALCRQYAAEGMHIVMVNPPRIYGKGIITESNAVTRLVKLYIEGKWRINPGDGKRTGSYVHVDDIVNGHVLAMQKGRSGERYILGGENVSYNEFFSLLKRLTGKKIHLFNFPIWLMMLSGTVLEAWTAITGKPPLLTRPWIRKYYYDWSLSSEKAIQELGYSYRSLETGLRETIDWLNTINQKK